MTPHQQISSTRWRYASTTWAGGTVGCSDVPGQCAKIAACVTSAVGGQCKRSSVGHRSPLGAVSRRYFGYTR